MPFRPTDDVEQDVDGNPTEGAACYLVFDTDGAQETFPDYDGAVDFAQSCADEEEAHWWFVYPLYAGEPIDVEADDT